MARAIVVQTVRRIAHARGRRVSRGYLEWIDRLVRAQVENDCHRLRGTVTLYAEDAAAAVAARARRL